jgi:hypothetical protein
MLRDLLVQAIDACAAWVGRDPDRDAGFDTVLWVTACQRTGGSLAATMPDELTRH